MVSRQVHGQSNRPGVTTADGSASIARLVRAPTMSVDASAGASLCRTAREKFRQRREVAAQVRLQIRLFGQSLIGTGTYHEAHIADDHLLRAELKVGIVSGLATFLQVNDGRYLWFLTSLPDADGKNEPIIRRVDMHRIRELQELVDNPAESPWTALGQGGLSSLLLQVERNFQLSSPQQGVLHGVPVWMVSGRWPKDRDASKPDAPNVTDDVDREPDNSSPAGPASPDAVTLVFGRDDLFPYLIEFQQCPDASPESERTGVLASPPTTILVLEFHEVRFNPGLNPQLFSCRIGDQPVQDITDQFIRDFGP